MEYTDKLVPFAVLLAVGMLLLFLLYRARREQSAAVLPERKASDDGAKGSEPSPIVAPNPPVAAPVDAVVEKPGKRKRKTAAPAPVTATPPTPIDSVVGMLQSENALATAFLLREIFDAPVSRRKR